jgi:hypothetical protein
MNRDPESIPAAVVAVRMKPLAPQHRIAHLRALLRLQPAGSPRQPAFAALLRNETAARPGKAGRVA